MTRTARILSSRSWILQVAAFSLAAGYLVWVAAPKIGFATQAAQKIIQQREHRVTDPIKIVKFSANSKAIRLNEGFAGDANWLRGTAIRLKNTSNKNIIYVEIQFNFPETTKSGPEMSFRSELGNKPSVNAANPALMLIPDDEVTFQLTDQTYAELSSFIGTRARLGDLNNVELKIGFVVFDDLIGWQNGIYFRQDVNNPRRWVPLSDHPRR